MCFHQSREGQFNEIRRASRYSEPPGPRGFVHNRAGYLSVCLEGGSAGIGDWPCWAKSVDAKMARKNNVQVDFEMFIGGYALYIQR